MDQLVSLEEVRAAVDVAAGRKAGTVLFKNALVCNVFSLEFEKTHVLLAGRLIAGVGEAYAEAEAAWSLDLQGSYLLPGLIDGHVHIESVLVTPEAYAEGVLARGVTGLVCDPHEIGNVAGVPGIRWLLERSERLPLDIWLTVPSCVPSTPHETSGAVLGLAEIESLLDHPRVVGVAEIMNFPAMIAADEENLAKALLAERYRKSPEGHAPALSGRDLQAYLVSGIASDHEATTLEEGLEKLRAGLFLMIREGSVTRNLEALMPLIQTRYAERIGFVTDDRLPHDLLAEGGVDLLVRRVIEAGIDPVYAIRCASYNTAKHYHLPRRGAIAPGYFADLSIMPDLQTFMPTSVYKEGREVARAGALVEPIQARKTDDSAVLHTVRLPALTTASFRLSAQTEEVRCLQTIHYQVLTKEILVKPKRVGDEVVVDLAEDLLKLVCIERHGKTGGIGLGLVRGFGLRAGALASTVGHDHHNLLAVSTNDEDLLLACLRLEQLGGGFVVVSKGQILAELALPIAGLLTTEPLSAVKAKMERLEEAAAQLGNRLPSPFMTLSFLGLAVIPELRLTDKGLVNVSKSQRVSFEVH